MKIEMCCRLFLDENRSEVHIRISGGAFARRAFEVPVMSLRTCYPTHSSHLPRAVWPACAQIRAVDCGMNNGKNMQFSGGFLGALPKAQEGST
jgi:hypothetical protein